MVDRPPDPDPLMSVPEVAGYVGFSHQTIHNWIKDKKLPAVRIARNYRIRKSDVDRALAAHTTTTPELSDDAFWNDPDAQGFQEPSRTARR